MSLMPTRVPAGENRPAHPANDLRREMDRLLADFLGHGSMPSRAEMAFIPRLNVSESPTEVTVTTELPGLAEDEVEVSLSQGRLVISGEKKAESEKKDAAFHVVERSYGRFSRAVELGSAFSPDGAAASFKNGILTVTVPRGTVEQSRKIDIKSG